VNDVTYLYICVTFFEVNIVTFVYSKTIGKMKEIEKLSNPSVRHNSRKEKKINHEYLLYSAGEDYYNIYQEVKNIAPVHHSKITGIRK